MNMADFIRARTEEQFNIRREMILKACEEIYLSGGLLAVTFNTVSEKTSLTRPALYNYYRNREEMLYDLARKYYAEFRSELSVVFNGKNSLTREEMCAALADLASEFEHMLKLFSDLPLIENECDEGMLIHAKQTTHELMLRIREYIGSVFPSASEKQISDFISNGILIFTAIYPYTHRSEKIREIERKINPEFVPPKVRDLLYNSLMNATASLE